MNFFPSINDIQNILVIINNLYTTHLSIIIIIKNTFSNTYIVNIMVYYYGLYAHNINDY